MANKVNGIKIYPKHSLGAILCASFGTFAGFMLVIGLTFFPILGATINGKLTQVNAFDYLTYAPFFSSLGLDGITGFTHFLNKNAYNRDFFDHLIAFRSLASGTGNYAVVWYDAGANVLDAIISFTFVLMMIMAAFLFIEGIIRLITGTYHKSAKGLTIACFFLMLLFITASFFTNFCAKYLAREVMSEGETYVPKACPMQYILFFLMLACWIVQHYVYNSMIKGKLYVADARLIKGQKELKKRKKTRRTNKEEEIPEEVAVEEVPVEEVPAEQPGPVEVPPAPEPVKAEEQPKPEPAPAPEATRVEEQPKPKAAPKVKPNEEPKVEANKEEAKKSE